MGARSHRPPAAGSDLGRVLVVDDEEPLVRVIHRVLTAAGYALSTATDGGKAAELLADGDFDAILSDIDMPKMNGIQLLQAVRQRDADVPVILMTGNPDLESAVLAIKHGALQYLIKPVDMKELARVISRAVRLHRLAKLKRDALALVSDGGLSAKDRLALEGGFQRAHDTLWTAFHADVPGRHLAEARSQVQSVVAQALTERTPLLETCSRIVKTIGSGLDWDFAATWTQGEGGSLSCVETWTRPGVDVATFEAATRSMPIAVGRELPGRAWAECCPQWIQDISGDARFVRAPLAEASGLLSGFAVPLGAEGEVFAVIEFLSRSRRKPDLGLLELLQTSGAQLGAQVLRERADRRAAEAEASERNVTRTLDAIVNCAPAFIVAIDENGTVQFANRSLPFHDGRGLIGSNWLDHVPPTEHEVHRTRLRKIIETGVPQTYEAKISGVDGETMWLSTHMGPMRSDDRIVGAVFVAQDITALKRTQTDFAASQRLAAVGTLAAGVAHEINTPVQFVNDSVHFLRDASKDVFVLLERLQEVRRLAAEGSPNLELAAALAGAVAAEQEADMAYLQENVPKALERCVDGLERVSTIVRSMKEFAHPDQGEMAPIDLNRAIQNTLVIARSEYRYVADVETDLADIPPVTCFVNDINQVVLNLVVNAAHAVANVVQGGDDKGTIRVRTREEGEHVIISVADTGPGIPEVIRHRVFEPFFTTKEVGKGTGQGLALAWTVVKEKHGGTLHFETKIGCGTTFFVRLPTAGKKVK